MNNWFNIQQQNVNPKKLYFCTLQTYNEKQRGKYLTGFGLYRTGIKGNIPSYYLGGYMSLGELEIDKSLTI